MPVAAEVIAVSPTGEMEQRIGSLSPDMRGLSASIANAHGRLVTAAIRHGAVLDGLFTGTFYSIAQIVSGTADLLSGQNAFWTTVGLSDETACVAVVFAPVIKEIAPRLPALAREMKNTAMEFAARMIDKPIKSAAALACAAQLMIAPAESSALLPAPALAVVSRAQPALSMPLLVPSI